METIIKGTFIFEINYTIEKINLPIINNDNSLIINFERKFNTLKNIWTHYINFTYD